MRRPTVSSGVQRLDMDTVPWVSEFSLDTEDREPPAAILSARSGPGPGEDARVLSPPVAAAGGTEPPDPPPPPPPASPASLPGVAGVSEVGRGQCSAVLSSTAAVLVVTAGR